MRATAARQATDDELQGSGGHRVWLVATVVADRGRARWCAASVVAALGARLTMLA